MSTTTDDAAGGRDETTVPTGAHRTRRSLLALLVVSVVASMVLIAWSGKRSLGNDPTGSRAPDFTLPMLEGDEEITLSDLRGQVVLLNFWSSWCTECKREAPVLEAGWQRWRDEGVQFLGVDSQDSRRWGLEFHREYGITYPSAFDGDGRIKNRYGVTGVPETFVIDRDGRITGKHIGALDAESLDQLVSEALTVTEDDPQGTAP